MVDGGWDQGTEMTGRCEITIAKDLDLFLFLRPALTLAMQKPRVCRVGH
jgi:hypothetical protein